MVAEDAEWLSTALLATKGLDGAWPITLFGHAARVVYEGSKIASDPQLGVPELAELLPSQHAEAIERSRQATKLLDDKLVPLADIRVSMAAAYASDHARFTGNSVRFARWLETDLAIATLNRRVIAASIPLHRRFGLASLDEASILSLSRSLGGALAVLAAMNGHAMGTDFASGYEALGLVEWRDRLTSRYLRSRFDASQEIETKLILLLLESEVATSADILPAAVRGFDPSVFRAQAIVLFHVLSAVQQVLDDSSGVLHAPSAIQQLVDSEDGQYILADPGFRQVRNYSIHYGIRDPQLHLDLDKPMFGLVESLTSRSFADLAVQVADTTTRLADAIRDWRRRD